MKLRITLVVIAASLGLGWVFCGPTLNHEIRVWDGRRKLSPTEVSEIERTVRHKRWLAVLQAAERRDFKGFRSAIHDVAGSRISCLGSPPNVEGMRTVMVGCDDKWDTKRSGVMFLFRGTNGWFVWEAVDGWPEGLSNLETNILLISQIE